MMSLWKTCSKLILLIIQLSYDPEIPKDNENPWLYEDTYINAHSRYWKKILSKNKNNTGLDQPVK